MRALNFKAYTEDPSQVDAIKAFMKALKIRFKVEKQDESLYNSGFVKKIQQGDADIKKGKGKKITIEELERLCK